MSRERNPVSTDHLVEQYLSGKTRKQLADEFGMEVNTVTARLRRAGHGSRANMATRSKFDLAEAVKLYKAGIGILGIARQLGATRDSIIATFHEHGIAMRDRSAQQFARMAKATKRERREIVAAANAAARGRKPTIEDLSKAALTREINQSCRTSAYEKCLQEMLRAKGIEIVPQKAIGPYNCDIAAHPVAVEIFGGHFHWHGEHLARSEERFRYMMNAGWNVIAVSVNRTFPLTAEVADYVAAYIEQTRRDPPAICEYRVIWGAGEFITRGRLDDDEFSIEPPFTNTRDLATGRYKRVRREA